jgi:glucan phosphoethanolaminetransferase (alkaline phosphatase superfamily)
MAGKKQKRRLKTVIGVTGALSLGTLGSLLANMIWNVKNTIIEKVINFLNMDIPLWILIVTVLGVIFFAALIKSKRVVELHGNVIVGGKPVAPAQKPQTVKH